MKKIFILMAAVSLLNACNDKNADGSSTSKDSSSMNSSTMNDEESKEERNKQTALASFKGFSNRDIEVVLKDVDQDAIDYGDGSMEPVKGRDTVRKSMEAWFAAVPNLKADNVMAAADGDHVMVYSETSGTWKNDFMGMKATGKSFKVRDVDIFKFNDAGKIIEHRNVQANEFMAKQLGMPMPAPPKKK
jgi:predicted ester cyclase